MRAERDRANTLCTDLGQQVELAFSSYFFLFYLQNKVKVFVLLLAREDRRENTKETND